MKLLSNQTSWNIINTAIQNKCNEEINNFPYIKLKEKLFYTKPKNIIYVNSLDSSDSFYNFIDRTNLENSITIILDSSISTMGGGIYFTYSNLVNKATLVFKHNQAELATFLNNIKNDTTKVDKILNQYIRFVVPTGLKTDYIDAFDELGNTYWDGLTAEEKSALIAEGSEEYEA